MSIPDQFINITFLWIKNKLKSNLELNYYQLMDSYSGKLASTLYLLHSQTQLGTNHPDLNVILLCCDLVVKLMVQYQIFKRAVIILKFF